MSSTSLCDGNPGKLEGQACREMGDARRQGRVRGGLLRFPADVVLQPVDFTQLVCANDSASQALDENQEAHCLFRPLCFVNFM